MGMGLFEYVDAHPYQGTADEARRDVADTISVIEKREKIEDLKQSISAQIRQGREPQYILYTAIRAISLLTNGDEWEQEQTAALNEIYGDVSQESLFIDEVATVADRLEAKQEDFVRKTLNKLESSIKACERLQKALDDAVSEVKEIQHNIEE